MSEKEQEPISEREASLSAAPPVADDRAAAKEDADVEAAMRRLSRRSFLWAGAVTAGAVGGLVAFNRSAPGDGKGIKQVFRYGHEFNEAVAKRLFFAPTHRAREFPRAMAVKPRNNYHGRTPRIDLDAWRLTLDGAADGPTTLTLADLQTLPAVSQTTELKCVEGWSAVVNWTGVRFADFAAKYPFPPDTKYVQMRSEPAGWEPEWYFVGLDIESCLHPQTLLAYAMNDAPLTPEHGAPLRLVMPHKYGIKNIKLITTIAYSAERPKDYWAELGYDWYAGL